MPLLTSLQRAEPTRAGRRWLAAIVLALALAFAGLAAWSAVQPDGYGRSRAGCVRLTIPSTTGGAMLEGCGHRARAMCQSAFSHRDRLSLLIRRPCRQAGLG